MTTPKISRPKFPKGYVDNPASYVTWDWVAEQLTVSENYWLSSVRANGKPHVVPRWGVFIDNKLYYDGSPETRHAQNILQNPHVTLHLESGYKVVILEGQSKPAGKPEPEFAVSLAEAMGKKYSSQGYTPKPDQWDEGGLYVFTPRQCLAWTSFFENPTKFEF
ncbi:MAG: pyridoxamine 5'-phosphate oxidase family protein [Chloroflexota bacterium]